MEVKIHPEIVKVLRRHTTEETHGLRLKLMTEGMNQKLPYFINRATGEKFQGDGHHRREICEKEGIPFEWRENKSIRTVEEAIEWVKENQASQRNLEQKEIAGLKLQRLENVAKSRAAGKSLRTIAKEEKVSKAQVERDLKDATCPPQGTPDAKKFIKGKDGKTYAKTRKRRNPSKNGAPKAGYGDIKTEFGKFVRALNEFGKSFDCQESQIMNDIRRDLENTWTKIKKLVSFQAKVNLPSNW